MTSIPSRARNKGCRGLITAPRAPSEIPTPADYLTSTVAVAVFCSALWSGFSPPLTLTGLTTRSPVSTM